MYTKDEPDTRRTIKVHSERIPGNVLSTIHATHCNICALENDNTVWENAMMEVDKTSRNENCLNLKCYFNVCLFKYYCCSSFVVFNVIYERCVSFFSVIIIYIHRNFFHLLMVFVSLSFST